MLDAGAIYFALDAGLQLGRLRGLLLSATPRTPWDRLALAGLYDDVVDEQRRLAIQALTRSRLAQRAGMQDLGSAEAAEQRVRQWLAEQVVGFARWQQVLAEIDSQSGVDVAMLAVAVRDGAVLVVDGSVLEAQADAIEERDPTGAGDAFDGVLLASLARGIDPEESLRRACGAGAEVAASASVWPAAP